ncbi:pyridoxamine 5'-phosphate oxidase family protein [Halomarina salina]|uniref:Pyridoxamine 5'-phosphate oxidase family protein n=1 Tax=Halomarina salina TaxID=1872699 RepID=A0ABD5RM97_9EURY|nr:pyridoxamine 5'-phosphate oxidase family protein [Halomarina salina]
MSSNPYGQFMGVPMSRDDVDALLTSRGYGIVSLCREGAPYSLPMSFGYDGDHVYFGFIEDSPDPTKLEYVEDGATVRLLVTDVRGRFDWRSVAVTGPVGSLDRDDEAEWGHFVDTMDDNAWFLRAFERSDAVEAIHGWELAPDEVRGIERTEEVYE